MTKTHKLLWSSRYNDEHEAVIAECKRVSELGGTFTIENVCTDNWYSIIKIDYPEESK